MTGGAISVFSTARDVEAVVRMTGTQLAAGNERERLTGQLAFLLDAARFAVAEDVAIALARWVLLGERGPARRPMVQFVDVRVAGSTGDAHTCLAATDAQYETEVQSFGEVDIVHEAAECGVYLERLPPGAVLPTHHHRTLDEWELVLGDGLLLQGAPVAAGVAHHWPRRFPHRYENASAVEQAFLCVDRPAFVPTDEQPVDVGIEDLARTSPTVYF